MGSPQKTWPNTGPAVPSNKPPPFRPKRKPPRNCTAWASMATTTASWTPAPDAGAGEGFLAQEPRGTMASGNTHERLCTTVLNRPSGEVLGPPTLRALPAMNNQIRRNALRQLLRDTGSDRGSSSLLVIATYIDPQNCLQTPRLKPNEHTHAHTALSSQMGRRHRLARPHQSPETLD